MDIKEIGNFQLENERKHWWIVTRFLYIDKALKYVSKSFEDKISIVEYGTGTAQNIWYLRHNSKYLSKISRVIGIDPHLPPDYAPEWFSKEDVLTNNLDYDARGHDFILAMDVLEHIDDDAEALTKWVDGLRPNGVILITVPAFMSLWSYHDEILDHKRRYRRKDLVSLAEKTGLEIESIFYGFSFIFPVAYLVRKLLTPKKTSSDLKLPNSIINCILKLVGYLEYVVGGCPFFGTSVIGIFRKKA